MNKIHNNRGRPLNILSNLKKVITGTSFSRFFGLLRDVFTTNLLGASFLHDIFVICLRIPNLFRRFFAEGAFNQAFVPIYAEYEKENNHFKTNEFLNSIAGTLLLCLFVFTLLVLVFAPIFIFLFAPGFYFDPIKQDISVKVLRIMFPYLALISLVAFAGGIQNTHQKFSIPAFTPVVFNLSLIIAAVFIAPKYEIEIFVLAWGVLLAGFVQLLIQIAPLRSINRLPVPKLNFKNEGVKKFFIVIFPAILAGGIIQINLLIDTIFASLLETGSPTWLYVSDRLVQFPMGIFAIGIGTVLLPTLSKLDVISERKVFINTLQKGQRFVLFIGIPSLIGLMFCAEDIISAIFYRGEFTQLDVFKSSYSLIAFSIGLPFFMLMKVLTPAFFAQKNTKTPMYVAILSLLLNAALNYILAFVYGFGHVGIAIGSSISALISVFILEIILYKDGFIEIKSIFNRFNCMVLLSSISLIIFLYFYTSWINFIELSQIERIFYLLAEIIISIIIYFSVARLIYKQPLKEILN